MIIKSSFIQFYWHVINFFEFEFDEILGFNKICWI